MDTLNGNWHLVFAYRDMVRRSTGERETADLRSAESSGDCTNGNGRYNPNTDTNFNKSIGDKCST